MSAHLDLRATRDGHPLDPVRFERLGLAGLLARTGHRATPVAVPGSAVGPGYRWRWVDEVDQRWWPQGIAVGEHEGIPLALVSWYAQKRRGVDQGVRITVVDLRDRRPRYHHVLLVEVGADRVLSPVVVHAGGIVWDGDRLLVAATFGGIREFRLSDLALAPRSSSRAGVPFGYRYVLPQVASHRPVQPKHSERMRYSFLSHEERAPGDGSELRLVAGEFGTRDDLRVIRSRLSGDDVTVDEVHVPGVPHMQGAVIHDDTWFIDSSHGDRIGGDLWIGDPTAMTRHEAVLPPGPEDLAVWRDRNQLWSVTEFPLKRWLFAVDLAQFGSGLRTG